MKGKSLHLNTKYNNQLEAKQNLLLGLLTDENLSTQEIEDHPRSPASLLTSYEHKFSLNPQFK